MASSSRYDQSESPTEMPKLPDYLKPGAYKDPLRRELKTHEFKEYEGSLEIPKVTEYKIREYVPSGIDPLTGKPYRRSKPEQKPDLGSPDFGSPVGSIKRTLAIFKGAV